MTTYSTLKRGGPLRQISEKRERENEEFARVRAFAMERDGHRCQLAVRMFGAVGVNNGCFGPLDPHHITPVGRDRTLRLDLDNLVTLCRRHHDWCHDHPAEATKAGLLRSAPVGPPGPQK